MSTQWNGASLNNLTTKVITGLTSVYLLEIFSYSFSKEKGFKIETSYFNDKEKSNLKEKFEKIYNNDKYTFSKISFKDVEDKTIIKLKF